MAGERRELADMLKTAGVAQPGKVIDVVTKVLWDDLREEFRKVLLESSLTPHQELMAVYAFDRAVRHMKGQR